MTLLFRYGTPTNGTHVKKNEANKFVATAGYGFKLGGGWALSGGIRRCVHTQGAD